MHWKDLLDLVAQERDAAEACAEQAEERVREVRELVERQREIVCVCDPGDPQHEAHPVCAGCQSLDLILAALSPKGNDDG